MPPQSLCTSPLFLANVFFFSVSMLEPRVRTLRRSQILGLKIAPSIELTKETKRQYAHATFKRVHASANSAINLDVWLLHQRDIKMYHYSMREMVLEGLGQDVC